MTTRGNRASMSLAQATAATCMVFPPVAEQRCEGDASAHGAAGENVAAELRMRAELAEQQLCDLKAALDDMKGQQWPSCGCGPSWPSNSSAISRPRSMT